MRTLFTLAASILSAAVLTACGGGTEQQCTVLRAAYDSTDYEALPFVATNDWTDAQLHAEGVRIATLRGIPESRVTVGPYALCD